MSVIIGVINCLFALQKRLLPTVRKIKKASDCIGQLIPCFDPFNKVYLLWELLILFIVLHQIHIIPYILAFDQSMLELQKYSLRQLEIYCLLVDILVQLNTMTFTNGRYTSSRTEIFFIYFKKLALVDVASVVFLSMQDFKIIGFFLRFYSCQRVINKIKQDIIYNEQLQALLELLILIWRVIIMAHLFACLWYFIGKWEQDNM